MTKCNQNILSDNLLFNFDISKVRSYNGNTGFTINSLISWDDVVVKNEIIKDYGLTMYDVGRINTLTGSTETNSFEKYFKLYPISYNDASGNTINTLTGITTGFDVGIGQYFQLSGGYLQNYFKLFDYDYELLPYRFNKGFTFETWVKLSQNTFDNITKETDGFFLYLGTRAENKFNILYSGDTDYLTQLSGSTLGSDDINNLENGLNNNVLAFKINNDSSLSIKMIDSNGYLLTKNSNKTITNISSGWTMFTITFTPYNIIDENIFEQVKDCYPIRLGDLKIYINGRPYWTLENFEEFYFKPLNTTSEKQIGVPYNISWGGGSFGLKHSYNFTSGSTTYPYEQNPYNQNLLIEQNFNGSFYGGIQKLRMYSKSLNFIDVLNNFRSDNIIYNKVDIKGGRIIYY
jgi:hypothetical protein